MIFIFRSNSLKKLAEKLGRELNDNQLNDPFRTREVIVPNKETSRWLKLRLSDQTGILANVSFLLPAEWQYKQVRKLYPMLPTVLPSDPGPLTWAIFEILMDETLTAMYPRAHRYLQAQPDKMKEKAAIQLAGKIASVYDQYLTYRPEMILNWQQKKPIQNPDEKWQAKLWNNLEERRHVREQDNGFPNKAELIKETSDALRMGEISPDQKILFFNTGLIPMPVLNTAERAAAHKDLLIFQTALSKDTAAEDDNELMMAFGEEAKGIELMLNRLEAEVENDFEVSGGSSLLDLIQDSIVKNKSFLDKEGTTGIQENGSIEVHSCHSPMREIEVLFQFILRLLERDEDLHPDDILVVTPSIESYKPFIHAVFNSAQKDLPYVPYHVDFNRSAEQGISGPFLQLLEIVDSRFHFNDVMDLFLEPSVRESFDISGFDARRIKNWMKENNVIWGLDSNHRQQQDQPGEHTQTWHAAMERGWKGILFGEQNDPYDDSSALYFHQIRGQDRQEAWSGFSGYLSSLKMFNQLIRENRQPVAWCELIEKQADLFFSENMGSDEQKNPVRSALDQIRDETLAAGMKKKIPFTLFRSQLRKILDQQSAASAIFTRGVTFSSMVPVRSIPAKVVALIGLNEADFPRKPNKIDFDLMAQNPWPTDRNPKNQDRSLFLESILAAQNVHYCSYIGRSKMDNEIIPPSPIISEWLHHLASLTSKKAEDLIVEEPLHGFSPENFRSNRSFSETAYKTARSILKNQRSDDGLFCRSELPHNGDMENLRLSSLLNYMQNPAKAFLKERFQPSLNDTEEMKNEFELNALERHLTFEYIFGWRLHDKSEREIISLFRKAGVVPAGWQGEQEAGELIKAADAAIEAARTKNYLPEQIVLEIDHTIGDHNLSGTITTYSAECFLDISPSGARGNNLLKSWIKHLVLQVSDLLPNKESLVLCDLKKGLPVWYRFSPAGKPEAELSKLITIYKTGLIRPALFFPNASYEFEKAEMRNKDNGLSNARKSFEGSDFSPYSDNMDPYVKLFLGDDAKFREEYLLPEVQAAVRTMLEHLEKLN